MLKNKIQEDLKIALKGGKQIETSTLRMLMAAIYNKQTEKRTKIWKEKKDFPLEKLEEQSQLTDEEIIEVIFSEAKKRKEAIFEFKKGKREDLVKKENQELEILQKYLPQQLSEEEIKKLAKESIEKIGAKEIKDMGKVMADLMPKVRGKTDGSLVSKIVKETLSSKNNQ